jgi:hypothetical protein
MAWYPTVIRRSSLSSYPGATVVAKANTEIANARAVIPLVFTFFRRLTCGTQEGAARLRRPTRLLLSNVRVDVLRQEKIEMMFDR